MAKKLTLKAIEDTLIEIMEAWSFDDYEIWITRQLTPQQIKEELDKCEKLKLPNKQSAWAECATQ